MQSIILYELFFSYGIHDTLPQIQKYVDEYNIDYLLDHLDILVTNNNHEVKKLDKEKTFKILIRIKKNRNMYNDIQFENDHAETFCSKDNFFPIRVLTKKNKLNNLFKQNVNQRNDLIKVLKYTMTSNIITAMLELIKPFVNSENEY